MLMRRAVTEQRSRWRAPRARLVHGRAGRAAGAHHAGRLGLLPVPGDQDPLGRPALRRQQAAVRAERQARHVLRGRPASAVMIGA